MRVAFVVQRYGQDVAGGAEVLCRQTAQAFASRGHAVTVLTTTARDYLHWAPHYPAGPLRDGPVSVHRFAADAADPLLASRLGRRIALGWGDWDDLVAWAVAQGPVSRGLLATLKRTAQQYDVVVLWTYLSATTHLAMPLVAGRAILVPMAHDEPMLRFDVTRGVMALASGFAFLKPEERRLVDEQHDIASRPQQVVGAGLAPAVPGDATRVRTTLDLPSRFALYLGRVDPGKGIDDLFRAHAAYRAAGGELGLVLAGRVLDGVPVPEWVRVLGFVDAQTKADLLAESDVLVLPSTNESLSLVLMGSLAGGMPHPRHRAQRRLEWPVSEVRRRSRLPRRCRLRPTTSTAGRRRRPSPNPVHRRHRVGHERDLEQRTRPLGNTDRPDSSASWFDLRKRNQRCIQSTGEASGLRTHCSAAD